jgi:ATP-dependent DNA helicase DinG
MDRLGADYRPRPQQIRLAERIAEAIDAHQVLVAEAGTGVGKTYAYLVPLLMSGRRALVSTATKALQDQLYLRDLPRLMTILERPLRTALLKGRAAYLCLQRLEQARFGLDNHERRALADLARIELWAQSTVSGDLAEVPGIEERSAVLALVSSTRDNCLGSDCPHYRDCHVMRARREALQADLVVINHHLYFADQSLRDTGLAELLPQVETVVFDEAHQLNEIGVQFLGRQLGTAALIDLSRDLQGIGLAKARGLADWTSLARRLEQAARDLQLGLLDGPGGAGVGGAGRLRWDWATSRPAFGGLMERLVAELAEVELALTGVAGHAPDLDRLLQRTQESAGLAQRFQGEAETGQVRWIDVTALHLRLTEAPLDIRQSLQGGIEAGEAAGGRAWIFTSATLGEDERLDWFVRSVGLPQAATLRVDSPFDYAAQARLWVPRQLPRPQEPAHPRAVAGLAERCARLLGGRTFVLTTSLRALTQIGAFLKQSLDGAGIEVLVQGQEPRRTLLSRFMAAHDRAGGVSERSTGAVLVGSQSFWEGIDVPGSALQCVIIDKLPFPVPSDPWVEARLLRCEAEGGDPFLEISVAEAAVALKQGAGRLIRSEADCGLLVVCDVRLQRMGYGRRLLRALPPMLPVADQAAAEAWLETLASL